jgi:hypothetical protein
MLMSWTRTSSVMRVTPMLLGTNGSRSDRIGVNATGPASPEFTADNEMSRRNKTSDAVTEATDAVRLLRPKPPDPVPELMIEIV